MTKLLLIKWFNTNVRSVIVAVGVAGATAGYEALSTQLLAQKFNWGVVGGAALGAALKVAHSAISRAFVTTKLGPLADAATETHQAAA